MRSIITRLHWFRVFILLFSWVAGVVVTVSLWVRGLPADPFVIPTLVGFTIMVWAPFGYTVAEMLHYREGWSYDGGVYRRHQRTLTRLVNASVHMKKDGRWAVNLYDSHYADENGDDWSAYWSEASLDVALVTAEKVMHDILYKDECEDSPF